MLLEMLGLKVIKVLLVVMVELGHKELKVQ